MAAKLSGLVQRFRPPEPESTDAELLRRFVSGRDEDAFAELVQRHGPLVFGVCRRVTGNHHLSEDAFQAVFVVLATKAGSVRPASLPAFLHGVATRIALRARTVADRRRRRETPVAVAPDAAAHDGPPAETHDLAALMDEEIGKLPVALRAVVVLCELEGCSRTVAACRLGVPEGTVSSRLAAARKRLADRLRRRGVVLGAAGLSAVFSTSAPASVPANLAARTLAGALTPALRPVAVTVLSTGALQIMLAQKLKTALPLVAVALLVAACAALAADHTPTPPPAPKLTPTLVRAEPPAPKAAPKLLPAGPNKLIYWKDGKLVLTDPDGKNAQEFSLKDETFQPGAQLSPDGKTIAFLYAPKPKLKLGELQTSSERPKLHVRPLEDEGTGADLGVHCESFVWSPNGTEIACSSANDKPGKEPETTSFVINTKTKERTELKLPAGSIVTDWAGDGRLLTTRVTGTEPTNAKARLYLMNRNGTEHKALAPDTNAMLGLLSPDGTRVLCVLLTFKEETPAEQKQRQDVGAAFPPPERDLAVLDVATGRFTKVGDVPLNADLQDYCWSPDGKRIAYTWRQKHEGKPEGVINKETESHLIVCDPSGKNAKTVASATGTGQWHVTLAGVRWR